MTVDTHEIDSLTAPERKRLRDTRGTVYVANHRSKAHIHPHCRLIKDSEARPKPIEALPGDHLDMCSLCVEHWRRWHESFYGFSVRGDSGATAGFKAESKASEAAANQFLARVVND